MRGVHQLLDATPLILNDPVSLTLLGNDTIQQIRENPDHHRTIEARALRAHVVVRSRFTEDCLKDAVRRGITQYVILGAGFDTFAFRQPTWAADLTIFEVDQPASQKWKISRIEEAGLTVPVNLKFAAVDFEVESLQDALLRHNVSFQEPTFFSWLGVTMYLREAATDVVLKTIAKFPIRSEVVFTYTQPMDSISGFEAHFFKSLSKIVSGTGEPFINCFTTTQLEAKLYATGFKTIYFLSKDETIKRYFRDRPQDLHIPDRSSIVQARL